MRCGLSNFLPLHGDFSGMNSLLATKYLEGGGEFLVSKYMRNRSMQETISSSKYSARDSILGPLDGQVDTSIKP